MKNILIIISVLFFNHISSQTFFKDKTMNLNQFERLGIQYAMGKNSDEYWLKKFDSYGESRVKLTFQGNVLKQVVIVQLDPTQTLNRLKDVYAKATNQEADTFDPPLNGYGSGIASNTPYYSGKAKYECSNNYTTRDYLFIITILD
jgi:hypothetical protein